jgi:hypothetical protein
MTLKIRSVVALSMLVALAFIAERGAQAGQSTGSSSASAEVTKVERTWEAAMHMKDSAAVDKILASDWTGLNPDGTLETRAHFLAAVKAGDYATTKLDEIVVSTLSGVVVAHGKASDKDGKYAYTDVFVHSSNGWRAAYSQIALLPPPPKK